MATSTNRKVGMGALAAAAAAAAAGYYFYSSPKAKQHRKIAVSWAGGLKKEVIRQAKKAQKMDRKQMLAVIDKAARAYGAARSLDRAELTRAAKELKDNWQKIAAEVMPARTRAVVRPLKKMPRKNARKRSSKHSR